MGPWRWLALNLSSDLWIATARAAFGTNLALNQPANQSSTQFGGIPERAVDGNIDGFFSAGSVTHTGGSSLCVLQLPHSPAAGV